MANLVLNADFRFSDAAERQMLRQMVAQQQARFYPAVMAVNYMVDQVRALAALAVETRAAIHTVSHSNPRLNNYL